MQLIPTILCGGAGSRLWPVSRDLHPKPFIRLTTEHTVTDKNRTGQSLLQKTFLRAASLSHVHEILVVTNHELLFKTENEFNELKTAEKVSCSFILEPFGRNTAAAIAAAALHVKRCHGEQAYLLILPADHLISDLAAFQHAVSCAMHSAQQGKLVTFGIQPTAPETGYGYIEIEHLYSQQSALQQSGSEQAEDVYSQYITDDEQAYDTITALNTKRMSQSIATAFNVKRFVEKPSLENAMTYLASGQYFWNSGMFCFSVNTVLKEMTLYCPEIFTSTQQCLSHAYSHAPKSNIIELSAELFKRVPENSIDYALLEHSTKVTVIPCAFAWSDVGSWSTLADLLPSDSQGNRKQGDVYFHNTQDCFVHSPYRLTSTLGVKNLMIIDTPDALLVADKSHSQQVKHIYHHLKETEHQAYRTHATVHRPWGNYTVLEEGPGFKIKRIVVNPGASLSLQLHHHRSEHWVVVSGMAKVINGQQELFIKTNESTYIPAGNKHRLSNPTQEPVVLIEVQSGLYLGEDDIVRFDDLYGRI